MSTFAHDAAPLPLPFSSVDLAVAAWLHAKAQRSQSTATQQSYAITLARFRALLIEQGLDLDAIDPRRVHAQLEAE